MIWRTGRLGGTLMLSLPAREESGVGGRANLAWPPPPLPTLAGDATPPGDAA